MAGRKRQVAFTLSDERIAKLIRRADDEETSMSNFVRRIVVLYLNNKLLTIEEHQRLLNEEMLKYERERGGAF